MDCLISVFFANAFLFYRTEKLLRNPPADLKYLGRYIDDLVGVWTGAPDDIPNLFRSLLRPATLGRWSPCSCFIFVFEIV